MATDKRKGKAKVRDLEPSKDAKGGSLPVLPRIQSTGNLPPTPSPLGTPKQKLH